MSAIRRIVVAGTGPVAWLTAAALRRAFPQRPLEVSVVDSGESCDTRIGRWTLPSQRGMHALLGVAESPFMQQTGATFKLATEHNGWQGAGSKFLHAHGEIGIEFRGTPFYKFLQSEHLAGRAERPEAFSVAGSAARLGKFARPMGDTGALTSSFTYGFHCDEAAYTNHLRAHAVRLGARTAPAALVDVKVNDAGNIEALTLADGSSVTADFFVDCSGPEARLLGRISNAAREDWSAGLPCDAMWSAKSVASTDAAAVTRTFAADAGWQWRVPLAAGSMVGHVFATRFEDAGTARASLQAFEPALRGAPVLTRFASGRRRIFWERNCAAIGASAVELEPLAGADLHIAQIGIVTLVELFPRAPDSTIEAAEYNRLMAEYADALRDFTLAHYHAGAPRPGEFWSAIRAQPLPANLAGKLDLYGASGRINLLDHESFEATDWAWLFLGSGLPTQSIELQIRQQLAQLAPQEVTALRTHVQRLVQSMPSHAEFLRHQASATPRARQ
jgi:tryptophan 7-halogenase